MIKRAGESALIVLQQDHPLIHSAKAQNPHGYHESIEIIDRELN